MLEETRADRDAVQKKLNKLDQKFKQRENDSNILIKVIHIVDSFETIYVYVFNPKLIFASFIQITTDLKGQYLPLLVNFFPTGEN